MKNTLKYIALAAVLVMGASSCEKFLDRPAEDNYNSQNFYQDADQCIQGVNYLYNSPWNDFIRGFYKVGEIFSGNMYSGGSPYMQFSVNGSDQDLRELSQALWAVNESQKRAGSKTISTDVTMDVIKKEKKFELWLEMVRWPDMVRWGDLDNAAKAGSDVPVLYDKLHRAPQSGDQGIIWENGTEANSRFYTVSTHAAKDNGLDVGFKKGKHEYFPFPDISKRQNPTLNQMPGWAN